MGQTNYEILKIKKKVEDMGEGMTHRRFVILAPFLGLRFTSLKLVLVFCGCVPVCCVAPGMPDMFPFPLFLQLLKRLHYLQGSLNPVEQ